MYQKLQAKYKGVNPLILHNSQTSNPLNYFAKEIKKISGKRKKTEEDYKDLQKLEWIAGLYINDNDKIIIPNHMILGNLIAGAKKLKAGNEVKAGAIVEKDCILNFDDMKLSLEKLYEKEEYIYSTSVTVQRNRIIRTRPIFPKWFIDVEIEFMPQIINIEMIKDIMGKAGMLCGLGDWRPQYGRFNVEFK